MLERFYKARREEELEQKLNEYTNHLVVLSDNWDGQGSRRYSEATIKSAKNLIIRIIRYFSDQRFDVPIPKILPVPDGSVDIKWKKNTYKLIINIPSDLTQLVEIYGEVKESLSDEIDCRFHYDLVEGVIINWLKKILPRGL